MNIKYRAFPSRSIPTNNPSHLNRCCASSGAAPLNNAGLRQPLSESYHFTWRRGKRQVLNTDRFGVASTLVTCVPKVLPLVLALWDSAFYSAVPGDFSDNPLKLVTIASSSDPFHFTIEYLGQVQMTSVEGALAQRAFTGYTKWLFTVQMATRARM
jgi:hypothetical protein